MPLVGRQKPPVPDPMSEKKLDAFSQTHSNLPSPPPPPTFDEGVDDGAEGGEGEVDVAALLQGVPLATTVEDRGGKQEIAVFER